MSAILKALNARKTVELKSEVVELGIVDDINKAKNTIISEWKKHSSKLDSWGAEANKVLKLIGELERSGETLKKEANSIDDKITKMSGDVSKANKQAEDLGVEIPKINLLDGVSIGAWGNKIADTHIIVDDFKKSK